MKYILLLIFFLPLAIIASCKPGKHHIEKITFSSDEAMSRVKSDLSIDSNRQAVYTYIDAYGKSKGPQTSNIDKATYSKLISDLDALDFPVLKDDYTQNSTDCYTYYLTITYDSGKVKKIQDFCRSGPKGLQDIYHEILILEDTQKWK